MENNGLKSIFNKILSNDVSPCFKQLNYKKQGNNFRYFDKNENIGKIVNFQKSQWSQIKFTINVGIYLPEFEYYHYIVPKISNEKFVESICAIRKRIGELKNGLDKWYVLNEETHIDSLINELKNDIKNSVLPFLNKFANRKYVLEQLFMESYYGMYEFTRIKVLYKNGFKDEILNIIRSENYQLKNKGVLDIINEWIKENE
jgi:hypothetical protein